VKELFPDGTVLRAELLRHDDDPGQLTVRVFIPATEDLAAWAEAHRERMEELRRELSLRLPSAGVLEFTSDAAGAPLISMTDDGSLAAAQLSSRQIVIKALALLRRAGPGPAPGRGGGRAAPVPASRGQLAIPLLRSPSPHFRCLLAGRGCDRQPPSGARTPGRFRSSSDGGYPARQRLHACRGQLSGSGT